MNKNIKEVLVRVEYHGQIWIEAISIENFYGKAQTSLRRYHFREINGRLASESNSSFSGLQLQHGNQHTPEVLQTNLGT